MFEYFESRPLGVNRTNRRNRVATVAKAADHFYQMQYRQFLNATMGAFAMTATQILLGSGGVKQGRLGKSYRKTYAVMLDEQHNSPPILVIDHQTVAIPLLLPEPENSTELTKLKRWLTGEGEIPDAFHTLLSGKEIKSANQTIRASERSKTGAMLEVMNAVLTCKRLAILAMHPHDPDAMALHITLFGTEFLEPEQLHSSHGGV